MEEQIKRGRVLRRHTEEGYVDEARIVHVDEPNAHVWFVPFPKSVAVTGKQAREGQTRLSHFIGVPYRLTRAALEEALGGAERSIVDYEERGWELYAESQLRAMAIDKDRSDRANLTKSLAVMDEQWGFIESLVNRVDSEVDLLNSDIVNSHARYISSTRGVDVRRVVRAVRAYMLGGLRKEALLPGWNRCNATAEKYPRIYEESGVKLRKTTGAKNLGVERGLPKARALPLCELDRKRLRDGWRKYKNRKATSVEKAYALTVKEYWGAVLELNAKTKTWAAKASETQIPTLKQFSWHGPKKDPALKASRVNLGKHRWARNHRPLMGQDGGGLYVACQTAYIDSTPEDQNLVLSIDRTIPLTQVYSTKVVEGYTGYIGAFYAHLERPSTMTTLAAIGQSAGDKVEYCKRYGIDIKPDEWMPVPVRHLRLDNGEGKSVEAIQSLTNQEVSLEFTKAYAAELKGIVETKHNELRHRAGQQIEGATDGKPIERGDDDPAKRSCVTYDEWLANMINAVIDHNNHARVPHLLTNAMRVDKVDPTRASILRWLIQKGYVKQDFEQPQAVIASSYPTIPGVVRRDGIRIYDPRTSKIRLIKGLLYSSAALHETGLTSKGAGRSLDVSIHIDPACIGHAWLQYRGLVELKLQTHDVEMLALPLKEWLEIVDGDRVEAYLHRGAEIARIADRQTEIRNTNKKARQKKKEDVEALAASGGRKPQDALSKPEAAMAEAHLQRCKALGLPTNEVTVRDIKRGGAPDAQVAASERPTHPLPDDTCANEPSWAAEARRRARNA